MLKKYKVKVNGNEYEVEIEELKNEGAEVEAPKLNTKSKKASTKSKASKEVKGSNVLKASMPGTILKVNVKEGDKVKAGDTIIVLESMKMETPVDAPADGVIASINVEEGASVNAGDVLASIE